MTSSRNKGAQPLDNILNKLGLKNENLVKVCTQQLTFKMVTRARKGRQISPHVQSKILTALNTCQSQKEYRLGDIFNY